jgi:hypothetical protein
MEMILVDKITGRDGRRVTLSDLTPGNYDLRFKNGFVEATYRGKHTDRMPGILERLAHIDKVYVCPAREELG